MLQGPLGGGGVGDGVGAGVGPGLGAGVGEGVGDGVGAGVGAGVGSGLPPVCPGLWWAVARSTVPTAASAVAIWNVRLFMLLLHENRRHCSTQPCRQGAELHLAPSLPARPPNAHL